MHVEICDAWSDREQQLQQQQPARSAHPPLLQSLLRLMLQTPMQSPEIHLFRGSEAAATDSIIFLDGDKNDAFI